MRENTGGLSHSQLKNSLDVARKHKVELEKSLEGERVKNSKLLIEVELAESDLESYEEKLVQATNRRDNAKIELETITKSLNESSSKMISCKNDISICESDIEAISNKIKTYELNLVSSLTIDVIENNEDLINILLNHIKDEVKCNE